VTATYRTPSSHRLEPSTQPQQPSPRSAGVYHVRPGGAANRRLGRHSRLRGMLDRTPTARRSGPAPAGAALPGGGAKLGVRTATGAAWAAPAVRAVVPDGRVQPEPARAGRPQLPPVALRHPGHADLRTLLPPGPAPPCSGPGATVMRPSDHRSREPIRPSLRIPIGFIMTTCRLARVSWPCRSRYATSAARSRPTDRGWRPGGGPPAGRGRLSAPPRDATRPRQAT
jgi:hypothetical protein